MTIFVIKEDLTGMSLEISHLLSECYKRQGIQVNIVTNLLRHGMVFIVLVSPPRTAHTTSDTVQHNL